MGIFGMDFPGLTTLSRHLDGSFRKVEVPYFGVL